MLCEDHPPASLNSGRAGSTAAAVFPPGEIESPAGVFALGERLRALRRVRLDGAFDEREGIIKSLEEVKE